MQLCRHAGRRRGHIGHGDGAQRRAARGRPIAALKDADDQRPGSGRTRSDQARPAELAERVADSLKRRPSTARRPGSGQADGSKPLNAAEIRELQIELPDVLVMRYRIGGRQPALGEPAIPLGDRCRRLVGEIESPDYRGVLPAPVGRLAGASQQPGCVRRVANPVAADGDRIDVHGIWSRHAGILKLGDELRNATIFAAGE